jgi:hypothetical protein
LTRNTARSVRASFSTISASNSRLSASADLHLARAFDHVVVGHDQAASVHDDARAEGALHLFLRQAAAEEAAEQGIVHEGIAVRDHPRGVDIHHRRRRLLHHRRIGQDAARWWTPARGGLARLPAGRLRRQWRWLKSDEESWGSGSVLRPEI